MTLSIHPWGLTVPCLQRVSCQFRKPKHVYLEDTDTNSSTATACAACHLGKTLKNIELPWPSWQGNIQNKGYLKVYSHNTWSNTCAVWPWIQTCTKGTILSSFIKDERQSLMTAVQELPAHCSTSITWGRRLQILIIFNFMSKSIKAYLHFWALIKFNGAWKKQGRLIQNFI